jgi:hypothetical protein
MSGENISLNIDIISTFEQESIKADNLYQTALSLKDTASPSSLSDTVTKQKTELNKEKTQLQNEIAQLKKKVRTNERDFLDQREEKGEIVPVSLFPHSLQDGAISFFIISWVLFGIILIGFGFMPPIGDFNKGTMMFIGYLFTSFCLYSLIHNYA